MNKDLQSVTCEKAGGFSIGEKVFFRMAFLLGIALGAWGMMPAGSLLAAGYVLYSVGAYAVLMRYTVCPRCLHLMEAGECVFLPAPLVKLIVSERTGPLEFWEYVILVGAVGGTALLPVYWLLASPLLFVCYVVVGCGWVVALRVRLCTRCHVKECPLNNNSAL